MWWQKAVVGGALLLSVGAAAERTSRQRDRALPERGRLIDAGGYQVRIYEAGESGPSVALVAGAGHCAASWVPVADNIATSARVTSYDRAGMGGSANGPPPTLDRYLAELSSVIPRARGDRPFILAGHSLGGLIVRIYAQQHPADVARLVLVDATPEAVPGDPAVKTGSLASAAMASVFRLLAPFGFVRFLLAIGKMPLYPEQDLLPSAVSAEGYRRWTAAACRDFAGAAGPELRSVLPTAAESQRRRAGTTAPPFGDLPLGVLTSHAWGAKWIEMHRELPTRSRSSFHQVTGKRSHNVHIRHPCLAADAHP